MLRRFAFLPLCIVLAFACLPVAAEDWKLENVEKVFEPGDDENIIITDTTTSVSIIGSNVTLSWTGESKPPFNPEETLAALMESMSEEEYNEFIEQFADFEDPEDELTKYLEKIHERDYVLTHYGGFFGMGGEKKLDFFVLDVVLTDSTIVFDIQNEEGGTWYLDHHKIHIGAGDLGATLNIINDHDTIVARQIDDIIEGEAWVDT